MRPQKQKSYQQRKHFNKKFDKKKPRPLSFDQLLRKFKKKVERAGTLQEIRKREFYEKPAQKKQRKKKVERAGTLQEIRKREFYEKPAQKKQRKKKEAIRKEQIRHEANSLPSQRYF